jgi:DNA-binding XRE family transcriptional regulator
MRPIRTKRELQAARDTLRDLRGQITALRKIYRHDTEAFEFASRGLRQLMRETSQAITDYERAHTGRLPAVVGTRNDRTGELELPRVLRLLRKAARLDQVELAERLGTKQTTISRWEREGYEAYNLRQLRRIADALGWDVEVSFLRRDANSGDNHED